MTTSGSLKSMTAFASAKGDFGPFSWGWELRSVNSKGLDQRVRVPDWLDGLEAALRAQLAKSVARGSLTVSLRLTRSDDSGGALTINPGVLASMLTSLATVEREAANAGLDLVPTRASDILTLRGVLDTTGGDEDHTPMIAQLKSEFSDLVQAFVQMRETEGAALTTIFQGQLTEVATLTARAGDIAAARRDQMADTLRSNLARVVENADGVDADRVAQELAIIAVKADVTEEIDRLGAHVDAARDLVNQGGPVGRKLDFLMQEFNREANTLCAKAQNRDLTSVGLELKAVIDQMREQVQNVE